MTPNIVIAFADDWGRYASAYRGIEGTSPWNELIETPNFDALATEGALFTNALVPAPTCTPCRSSILAGRYFWQTGLGSILMGSYWDDDLPTFPLELEARGGYEIGHTYKVWSPGQTRNAPMGGLRTAYNKAGLDFNQFSHFVTRLGEKYGIETAKELLLTETRDNIRSFLLTRRTDRPFCYWWGPANTHRSWERGSGRALWDIDPDDLEGRMPGFMPDVHDVREDVADYLGECLAFDRGLGVLVEELKKAGQYENTIIVVSGDHGIPGIPRSKNNLYDIGCEVALAVRWPGVIKPGRVVDDLVNLMDLGPTLCEVGGIDPPAGMSATSLMPLLRSPESGQVEAGRDFVVTGRERHVAQARAGFLPYPQRALRGSTGGRFGQGGDLLYRWGNPQTTGRGDHTDQVLFWQHDTYWLPDDVPHTGDMLVFNNGMRRNAAGEAEYDQLCMGLTTGAYADVLELKLPRTPDGGFALGQPAEIVWSYNSDGRDDVYSPFMAGAQRMANGNTLMMQAYDKRIVEVDHDGEKVLDFHLGGPGRMFRIYKYPRRYPGIQALGLP